MKTSTANTAKQKSSGLPSNLGGLVVGLFLIVLLGVFISPWFAQRLVQNRLSNATGLHLRIGTVHFNLTRPKFWIKDLQFYNPKGFPASPLALIEEVNAKYSPFSVLLGRPHFKKVQVNFKEFRLMRNDRGLLNLPAASSSVSGAQATIDELDINLDKVTFTDLSTGQPQQQTFNLGLVNSTYRNVKGVAGIVEILNWEVLKRTGVPEKITVPTIPVKPIAELRAVTQTSSTSAPPPQTLPGSAPSKSSPSSAPSAQGAAAVPSSAAK